MDTGQGGLAMHNREGMENCKACTKTKETGVRTLDNMLLEQLNICHEKERKEEEK